ncbi:hypothetical protein CC85DRAFT_10197 [Cutaneotrichosporon oleaginosum]|uniref:Uncharacterized protein n=1 Tax=Cutaneotrichosporon oleaginosum TaxID=879819 RepID=A0A0J1B9S5_9TREE|nr:uncharacterized protein CC85DRAFT_10197 [Cutaneotrichosporon oleaginosum]KLT44609.1 hypothetical protein CC85DRAFT_10197 [Cutaneotrichosporon oleaginosum]TXT13876.1 hypothetical protein COLE_00069 [Cutaneotrichosporon oleaginosum]
MHRMRRTGRGAWSSSSRDFGGLGGPVAHQKVTEDSGTHPHQLVVSPRARQSTAHQDAKSDLGVHTLRLPPSHSHISPPTSVVDPARSPSPAASASHTLPASQTRCGTLWHTNSSHSHAVISSLLVSSLLSLSLQHKYPPRLSCFLASPIS